MTLPFTRHCCAFKRALERIETAGYAKISRRVEAWPVELWFIHVLTSSRYFGWGGCDGHWWPVAEVALAPHSPPGGSCRAAAMDGPLDDSLCIASLDEGAGELHDRRQSSKGMRRCRQGHNKGPWNQAIQTGKGEQKLTSQRRGWT